MATDGGHGRRRPHWGRQARRSVVTPGNLAGIVSRVNPRWTAARGQVPTTKKARTKGRFPTYARPAVPDTQTFRPTLPADISHTDRGGRADRDAVPRPSDELARVERMAVRPRAPRTSPFSRCRCPAAASAGNRAQGCRTKCLCVGKPGSCREAGLVLCPDPAVWFRPPRNRASRDPTVVLRYGSSPSSGRDCPNRERPCRVATSG